MSMNYYISGVVMAAALCACSSSNCNTESNDASISDKETTEVSAMSQESDTTNQAESKIIGFLEMFYKNYVFGNEDIAGIKEHFSQEVLNKMKDAYDFDCEDGDCYASWVFRSGEQDGPLDLQTVTSIEKTGENEYCVTYNDMGHKGKCMFSAKLIDGNVVIENFI